MPAGGPAARLGSSAGYRCRRPLSPSGTVARRTTSCLHHARTTAISDRRPDNPTTPPRPRHTRSQSPRSRARGTTGARGHRGPLAASTSDSSCLSRSASFLFETKYGVMANGDLPGATAEHHACVRLYSNGMFGRGGSEKSRPSSHSRSRLKHRARSRRSKAAPCTGRRAPLPCRRCPRTPLRTTPHRTAYHATISRHHITPPYHATTHSDQLGRPLRGAVHRAPRGTSWGTPPLCGA